MVSLTAEIRLICKKQYLAERLEALFSGPEVAMTRLLHFTCHAITGLEILSIAMKAFRVLGLTASLLLGSVAFAAPPPSLQLLAPEPLNIQQLNLTKTFDEKSLNSSKYIRHSLALA